MKKDPNKYPKGLNAAKVRKIIEYYDHQSDEEAAAEIENAPRVSESVWMEIPARLVPQVKKLISKRKSA